MNNTHPKRHRTWLVSVLATAVLGACGETPPPPPLAQPPAVGVVLVGAREVSEEFSFVARTEAIEAVELRARVNGVLEQRNFREGADIEKGLLLFQIERAPYEATLDGAKAELSGAEAAQFRADRDVARLRAPCP